MLRVVQAALTTTAIATAACTQYVDKFDEAPLPLGLIPELSPVNASATGALTYTALDYITGPGQLVVEFPSAPNVIGGGALSKLREGKGESWQVRTTPGPTGQPTAQSFNQKSVSFICVLNLQNSLAPPAPCTIKARGRRADGSIVTQELVHEVDIPGNFSFAEFTPAADWTDLTKVDLEFVETALTDPLTAMIYDNNAYEVCE